MSESYGYVLLDIIIDKLANIFPEFKSRINETLFLWEIGKCINV